MKIGITERGDAALHDGWYLKRHTVDGIILITKDPALLNSKLKAMSIDFKFVVHCTITGYGGTALEPNVPPVLTSLNAYWDMRKRLSKDNVVLRIDPIIPVNNSKLLFNTLYNCADGGRVRVSFLDWYQHVRDRFKKYIPNIFEELNSKYNGNIHLPLDERKEFLSDYDNVEVCGEPGMECSGCVSARDLEAMGLDYQATGKSQQRAACACMGIKTELLTHKGQCKHGCLYCYWR